MLSRAATCGVLNGLGDMFSQLCVEQIEFDVKRCLTFTFLVRARGPSASSMGLKGGRKGE